MNLNLCFYHRRLLNRKLNFQTKAVTIFACLHICVCVCMYANVCVQYVYLHVCVRLCTSSKHVWVCASPVALLVCGPLGSRGAGFPQRGCHGRLVRRRWRIKVSLGFLLQRLSCWYHSAEGLSCTLFKIQHEEETGSLHQLGWKGIAHKVFKGEKFSWENFSANEITSNAHELSN